MTFSLRRRRRDVPYFTGWAWVWPSEPARVTPLDVLMHDPSPMFPEGAPLAPGICPCRRCASAEPHPHGGADE